VKKIKDCGSNSCIRKVCGEPTSGPCDSCCHLSGIRNLIYLCIIIIIIIFIILCILYCCIELIVKHKKRE